MTAMPIAVRTSDSVSLGAVEPDEASQLANDRLGIRHEVLVEDEMPRMPGGGRERASHVGEPELDPLLERH